jgi:hypothetical protein
VAGSGAYNSTTGVITIPTNNNQITNGAGYITSASTITGASGALTSRDNRTISPSEDNDGQLKFGFTSWANNDGAPYADYLHLRSYTDNSGGNDNLVMFLKSGIGMRIYQQSFGSATAYSSFKDIAFTDGTNATGTWGINITGNSATANTWSTARTITIGNTGKSVNGSSNVSWSLAEIGAQAALTNPVTGTGTTNYLPKFTGESTIGNSAFFDAGGFGGFNSAGLFNRTFVVNAASGRPLAIEAVEFANVHSVYIRPNNSGFNLITSNYLSGGVFLPLSLSGRENNADLVLQTNGNVTIGTTTDNGNRLRVNGTIFSDSSVTATSFFESSDATIKTLVEDDYQAKGIESVVAKLYIKNGKKELGYYAQDLEGVLPSAVSKGSNGLLNLSYREVHTAKIAYLEQRIKQLENELVKPS